MWGILAERSMWELLPWLSKFFFFPHYEKQPFSNLTGRSQWDISILLSSSYSLSLFLNWGLPSQMVASSKSQLIYKVKANTIWFVFGWGTCRIVDWSGKYFFKKKKQAEESHGKLFLLYHAKNTSWIVHVSHQENSIWRWLYIYEVTMIYIHLYNIYMTARKMQCLITISS